MTGSCWREEQLSNMVRHDAEGKAENGLLETPSIISRADLLPAFSAHDVTSADEPSCTDPTSCSSHAAARSARSEDPSYPAPVSSLYQTSVTILGGLDLAPASKSPLSGPSCSSPARNEPSHTSAQSAPLVDSETSVDLSSRLSVEGAALESTIVTVFAEGAHGSPLNSLSDPAFVIPDGNQSSIREQSGDLGHSAVEQERRSEENAVCDPPSIVRENSTEADQALAAAKTAPNGQISLQPERPIGASSGVPVNAAVTTKHLEVSSEEICAEKSAKRMAEGESMADKPVKRRRKYDFLFPEPETVEAALGHTAEIVIILAGMAQMRAGRAFTCVERNLAAAACQNIAALVSKLAPNALVSKEALEAMMQELDLKRMTQTRKEEQARAKALAEAEAVAKAKAVKAEAIAKLKLEEEARLKAEAEAQERRKATLNTASMVVDTPVEDALSAGGLPQPDTPPAQSTSAISPLLESTTSSTPVGQSTGHGAAQVGDVFQSEESPLLGTSQSQQSSKTPVGKPPKVRNRIRKDLAAPSLLSPDYLEYIHNQVPEPQRAQITHKQLCLAVQQFIQDQMPHAPQTHQALQHSYINTPAPCKLCKLVAKDTGTVVVCDSCDQLFHLKCVQPNNHTKGVPKGDWNCPSCSSGGRYYREKYGLYRRGSANGVKLWAPHEIFGDTNSLNDSRDSSIEAGTATGSKQMEANPDLTSSSKLRVEVGAGGHPSKDERGLGNYGGSPHLIVHLVNEPSPRTSGPDQNSSQNLVSGDRSGSQTKLTSRPGHVETKTVRDESEELGTDMQMEYGDEEDAEENFEQVLKAQVGRREKTAEKGNADFSNSLTGMQVEIPMLMEWVGDSIRTGEGKTYYRSCRVGGLTYHLSDCALFRPETPDVPPYIARLQALWEDLRTSHKWVRVSWCYYPSDIPVAMGRPGRAEPDEVYESNHCDNNLVGSIQGPCLVLSSKKFRKEHDRRKELQKRGGSWDSLPPVFLSRWLYDAPKGIFKAVSE